MAWETAAAVAPLRAMLRLGNDRRRHSGPAGPAGRASSRDGTAAILPPANAHDTSH
jgi:hypothetical protein